jgi:dolichyl-phosphate beta-glucosyltransferase
MVPLSVIVPVYNGELYIAKNLTALKQCLDSFLDSFEIIVVDDGSCDNTCKIVQDLPAPFLVRRFEVNCGKGAAVKEGMLASSGDFCFFIDADLPFNLNIIPFTLDLMRKNEYHIVIVDRTLPNSEYDVTQTFIRRKFSRLFSFFVRLLVTGGLFDTQCGFKAFRGDIARELFRLATCSGFSFDVEMLYVALKYNMVIRRIPARYSGSDATTFSLVSTSFEMVKDISTLRSKWRRGAYKSELLEKICRLYY